MAYITRAGKRFSRPNRTATNTIQRLVKLEGTKATFECPSGHKMFRDYGKGPKHLRMSESMLKRFSAYWGLGLQTNGTRGHVYGWCQKCQNSWDGVE